MLCRDYFFKYNTPLCFVNVILYQGLDFLLHVYSVWYWCFFANALASSHWMDSMRKGFEIICWATTPCVSAVRLTDVTKLPGLPPLYLNTASVQTLEVARTGNEVMCTSMQYSGELCQLCCLATFSLSLSQRWMELTFQQSWWLHWPLWWLQMSGQCHDTPNLLASVAAVPVIPPPPWCDRGVCGNVVWCVWWVYVSVWL